MPTVSLQNIETQAVIFKRLKALSKNTKKKTSAKK